MSAPIWSDHHVRDLLVDARDGDQQVPGGQKRGHRLLDPALDPMQVRSQRLQSVQM
jgi:hypothetical protein